MKVKCVNLEPLIIGNRRIIYTKQSKTLTLGKEYEVLNKEMDCAKDKYTGLTDKVLNDCYTIITDDGKVTNCFKQRFEIVNEFVLGKRKIKKNAKDLK